MLGRRMAECTCKPDVYMYVVTCVSASVPVRYRTAAPPYSPDHLGGVDDAGLHQVLEGVGGGVVAVVLHGAKHTRATATSARHQQHQQYDSAETARQPSTPHTRKTRDIFNSGYAGQRRG